MKNSSIIGINGPGVMVSHAEFFFKGEMVRVGSDKLWGEVLSIAPDFAIVQVYEDTTGLRCGDIVRGTSEPLSVNIMPGIVGNIFDGIGRPLREIPPRKWAVRILVKPGDALFSGDIFAEVEETSSITYRAMVPSGVKGVVQSCVADGEYEQSDAILSLHNDTKLTLSHGCAVRQPRPIKRRLAAETPMITGQRVIDSLFPIARGGVVAIPGGFGTGKTQLLHQFAKYCDADLIIYIGCGERGNEMTEVLADFEKLTDPRTGKSLMSRTVLIANSSDMPVAAREACIYTGITIAEAYRDMGYHVAIMADSTSRWAEALREISARLGEIPAEEGYPAYLASRLAAFYERAGSVENLNGTHGSITIMGALSPQGADFSEPVTVQTKRFIRCFLALDKQLAYARHYTAISWLQSYSEYENLKTDASREILRILKEENELMEIAKLIGADNLPPEQQKTLGLAREIRENFAKQNAYTDAFTPLDEQRRMMEEILGGARYD